jgi:hypothetical protein
MSCVQTTVVLPSGAAKPDLRLSLTKMEDEGLGKGKMQAVVTSQPPLPPGQDGPTTEAPPSVSYTEERGKRVLYSDPELHLTVSSGPLERIEGDEQRGSGWSGGWGESCGVAKYLDLGCRMGGKDLGVKRRYAA